MPELPLTSGGKVVSFPAPRVWSEMCYPDDRLAAMRAWEQLCIENLAIQSEHQDRYSHIATIIQNDMNRSVNLGKLCGYVACQMRWNYEKRGAVSKEKACFAVSEFYTNEKTVSGKNIPTDGKRLRTSINQFAPVLHLWAAYVLLNDNSAQLEKLLEGGKEFDALLILALDMQAFIQKSGAFRKGEAIFDRLLTIPPIMAETYSQFAVAFPDEPEEIAAMLEKYTPNALR